MTEYMDKVNSIMNIVQQIHSNLISFFEEKKVFLQGYEAELW